LFFGHGDSVVVVEPATTVASIVTTVPAIVPATPMTWDRIDEPVVFGGDDGIRVMTDIAVGDGIAVAVGADGSRYGDFFDAAIWYSVDGITWNRVPHDEAVFGGDGHQGMSRAHPARRSRISTIPVRPRPRLRCGDPTMGSAG
jgi:hypothetical protein